MEVIFGETITPAHARAALRAAAHQPNPFTLFLDFEGGARFLKEDEDDRDS